MTGESRKKKDAGQLRPASLTRHCARGDGQAQWGDQGSPRGISERSEPSAYFFIIQGVNYPFLVACTYVAEISITFCNCFRSGPVWLTR